jgi:hypothetical protein
VQTAPSAVQPSSAGGIATSRRHRWIAARATRQTPPNARAPRAAMPNGTACERLKTMRSRDARVDRANFSAGLLAEAWRVRRASRGGTPSRGSPKDTVEHRVARKRRCPPLRNGASDPVVPSIRLTARELLEQYRGLERVMSKICRGNGPRVYSRCCSPNPHLPRAPRSSSPDVGRVMPSWSLSVCRVGARGPRRGLTPMSRSYRSRHSGSGAPSSEALPLEALPSEAGSRGVVGGAPECTSSVQRSLLQSRLLPLLLLSSPMPRGSRLETSGSRRPGPVELIDRN